VLDPLNNLNTPCALALFLGSMDTTAKRLTRVRSYPYRLQFPVARYLSPGQNVKRDHFLRLRSPALSGLWKVTCPLRQPEAASRAQSPGRESETDRRSDKSRDSGRKRRLGDSLARSRPPSAPLAFRRGTSRVETAAVVDLVDESRKSLATLAKVP
jgi:hypothetical protein